ncbi:putative uncharacterized protein DDB_G0267716 [Ruditapes philippinarum]|uniref:putative uncharacterized protein DDB_G0267716 n=1 Tax=Ruditapes philippinarum TaxID=129788 RepID=UPI00295C3308|nr:putative uncharacterized protein DDB_G0267716 [Ruditapes philippinarum]
MSLESSIYEENMINTENRFESLNDLDGWGTESWKIQERKRKKKNSSVECDDFAKLSTDDKLTALFEGMNRNFEKLESLESKQSQYILNFTRVNEKASVANERVTWVERCLAVQNKKLKMLSYKSLDIEARSRRNNLIFWGLSENNSISSAELISNFLRDELDLNPPTENPNVIERAHRLGSPRNQKYRNMSDPKRPLIVKFKDYIDTEIVLNNAYKLKGTPFSIDRDYPHEIVEARKELYSTTEAREARSRREKIVIKYPAKLYINNKLVHDMFPEWFEVLQESRVYSFEPSTSHTTTRTNTNDIHRPSQIELIDHTHNEVFDSTETNNTHKMDHAPTLQIVNTADISYTRSSSITPRAKNTCEAGMENNLPVSEETSLKQLFKVPRRSRSINRTTAVNSNTNNSKTANINPNRTQSTPNQQTIKQKGRSSLYLKIDPVKTHLQIKSKHQRGPK